MRNRLQYFYSISVLLGVLVTAYLMMSNENQSSVASRTVDGPSPIYKNEAAFADPALTQLLEMEQVLAKIKRERLEEAERLPSNQKKRSFKEVQKTPRY